MSRFDKTHHFLGVLFDGLLEGVNQGIRKFPEEVLDTLLEWNNVDFDAVNLLLVWKFLEFDSLLLEHIEVGLPVLHVVEVLFNMTSHVNLTEYSPFQIFRFDSSELIEKVLCLDVDSLHELRILFRHLSEHGHSLTFSTDTIELEWESNESLDLMIVFFLEKIKGWSKLNDVSPEN